MPIEGNPFTPEGELRPEVYDGRVIHRENAGGMPLVDLDHKDGHDLEFSVSDIEQRPISFDIMQEFIVAAVEDGSEEAMILGKAAELLRDEMHRAYVMDVSFQPSLDEEMRDELAEWLVGEVEGLTPGEAIKVVSLEGLDFPPASAGSAQLTETIDLPQAA